MQHGTAGLFDNVIVPRSRFYSSPFGRLFDNLEPWVPDGVTDDERERTLDKFARDEMFEPVGAGFNFDNDKIPAGYTYLGQFIDHDITFDPTSSLMRHNDPNHIHNFRTPRLDLDSVYGGGPKVTPYLYDSQRVASDGTTGFFLIEANDADTPGRDLPRNSQGTALIGDPRNDENVIVAQIQLAFLRLHNRVLNNITDGHDANAIQANFNQAHRIVRWFYQYIVWHDYVKKIVVDTIHKDVLKRKGSRGPWDLNTRFYHWKQAPYMPVEFSVAAYRFGHSQVRPGYQMNFNLKVGVEKPIFVMNPAERLDDLRGGRRLPAEFTVQWDWFLKFATNPGGFPQNTRQIDTKLARSVFAIPDGAGGSNPLAALNLRRGWRMGLPSGPAVAKAMGEKALPVAGSQQALWYYILHEAEKLPGANKGKMLGRVGSHIVAEVFAGLLMGDSLSYFNIDPNWTPDTEAHLQLGQPENGQDWEFADLIKAAGMPITKDDI
ncbi:MAG: hypothetical protein KDE46_12890 [Caldilineaceae bacterium]|nr:hypothetical protein [Caldilineaceae bacterium]